VASEPKALVVGDFTYLSLGPGSRRTVAQGDAIRLLQDNIPQFRATLPAQRRFVVVIGLRPLGPTTSSTRFPTWSPE